MPRYAAVLFDLDGTLIDSIGLIVESFHHTFATFGLPPESDAVWLGGIGTPLRGVLAPWARDEAMLRGHAATAYRVHFVEHHDARVRAYPGIPAVVRRLLAAGIRLAVVTSKNRPGTLRGLRAAGLEGAIEALVCAEDVQNAKPHREAPVDQRGGHAGGRSGGDALRRRQPARHARRARGGGADGRGALGALRPRPPRGERPLALALRAGGRDPRGSGVKSRCPIGGKMG